MSPTTARIDSGTLVLKNLREVLVRGVSARLTSAVGPGLLFGNFAVLLGNFELQTIV